MSWPGAWHSKVKGDDGFTNDHGTLYLTDGDSWLFYDPDGYDPRTEVRR
jgi:hypothetical protein